MTWHPVIDESRCMDDCFKCVNFCPKGVFDKKQKRPLVANPGKCVDGCEGCKSVCPSNAISFTSSNSIQVDGQEIGLLDLDAALAKPTFEEAWKLVRERNYVPDSIADKVKMQLISLYESSRQ